MNAEGSRARIPTVYTVDFPHSERAAADTDGIRWRTHSLRPEFDAGSGPEGELHIADIAWLRVTRFIANRHRLVHEPRAAALHTAAMVLQVRGTSVIRQQDRATQLVAGHWCVCNAALRYTVLSPVAGERLALLIPADRLDDRIDLAEASVKSFSGRSGVSRVAFGAASSLVEELTAISNARAEELAENLSGLMNLAIHERLGKQQPEAARPSLADRIHAYVVDNLRDPDLSLGAIARHLNASKRSLHRAVSDRNGSIHDLIWRERLERCRQDLLDPAREHHSIAEIAQSWGFKNPTHFSRAFRTRYGLSAREARRIARQQTCTA